MDELSSNDKPKAPSGILRIIILIVIIALIGVVWFVKSSEDKKDSQQVTDNPDFVLEVEAIDIEKLKSYGIPMLIDFGSDGCEPCRRMFPTLVKLNGEWQDKVIVKFTDVWKYTSAADGYPVSVIPTQFFFDSEGKPYVPGDSIALEFKMYADKETGEHVYTCHEGYISEDDLRAIFKEMGVE